MFRKTSDFIADWKYESESTLKLLGNLTDESLQKTVMGEVRKIGRLSWHLVVTMHEMMTKTGLDISGPSHDSAIPKTAKEVCDSYKQASESVLSEVAKWSDDDLLKEDNMYGEMWKRGVTLSVLIKHQAHHRGQLTILMRQAGLKIIGVYGPTREEWAGMGMPPME